MVNFARELFVCVCPTDVAANHAPVDETVVEVAYRRGTIDDLARLDVEDHKEGYLETLRTRFSDHYWLLGELAGTIVTYTWLHTLDRADYRYIPGCEIHIGDGCGYGYDAWTPPSLRGKGLRRGAFREELRVLRELGCDYEASFFVKHQLHGATRSLGLAGISVIPLWRILVGRNRLLSAERVHSDEALADLARPLFA